MPVHCYHGVCPTLQFDGDANSSNMVAMLVCLL